jgi:hypothetical protein
MRRATLVGLVLAAGGCAEFDEWAEPEHSAEYRRGGYSRDDRTPPQQQPRPEPQSGPGVFDDR